MSKVSDEFVNRLKAAFPRMMKETVSLYQSKLANWHLSGKQWESALDDLLSFEDAGAPPPLKVIFEILKQKSKEGNTERGIGRATWYNKDGYAMCLIVEHNGREWVIADIHGQQHIGESVVEHIPADATGYELIPNKMFIPTEEIVKWSEVMDLVNQTTIQSM